MSELPAWLRLLRTSGIGPVAFCKLLDHFGSPTLAVAASKEQWLAAGMNERQITSLSGPQPDIEADLTWLEKNNHNIVTLTDPCYPEQLKNIPSAPPLLYTVGDVDLLKHPQLAIVGSRNVSRSGESTTRAFAEHLAASGLGITSGLALGVDAAAHEGALKANGITLAVMGTGLDRVYPARNKYLADQIAEQGVLVSEFPLGTRPSAMNFPRRNRIISGLSLGTLVVEAALKSGSLITARYATEQGREVFAIPGSIHSPLAKGCHQLIRQGAKLVETSKDILEDLAAQIDIAVRPTLKETKSDDFLDLDHKRVLSAIDYHPTSVDMIIIGSGLSAQEVSSILLIMELNGYIAAEPGGYFVRIKSDEMNETN